MRLRLRCSYAVGTGVGGVAGLHPCSGALIDTGSRSSVFAGAISVWRGADDLRPRPLAGVTAIAAERITLEYGRTAARLLWSRNDMNHDRDRSGFRADALPPEEEAIAGKISPDSDAAPIWCSALAACAVVILLDIDGTLLDLAPTPREVWVPPDLAETLSRLHERTGGALALVSAMRQR